ncbi:unnamed protein product [Hermetia illucens]|uniref:Uncharacterized protein n=1 Tax=Hermetia illucens TaxID=343691 RepID=A0A7R8UUB5_HERIL|nr:unnamed protein product [Hermetia illucens]
MFSIKFIYLIFLSFGVVSCQSDLPTQPTWLVDDHKKKGSGKVEVNLKNLAETASIRSEIESAISHHKYAVGGKNEYQVVHEADRELGADYREHSHDIVGAPLEQLTFRGIPDDSAQNESRGWEDWMNFDIIANKVTSSLGDEIDSDGVFVPEYDPDRYSGDQDTREVLQLNLIREVSFLIDENVSLWKSLRDGKLLGRAGSELLLAEETNGIYQIRRKVDLKESIEAMEVISFWNTTSQSFSTLAAVSLDHSIRWINLETVQPVWEWMLGLRTHYFQYFESGRQHFVAALFEGKILIYQIDFSTMEYWAMQSISVERNARELIYLDVGYHIVLAVPQNNSVLVLRSEVGGADSLHFEKMPPIRAENVSSIHGFRMGSYSYLAVGGSQPKIYRYHFGVFQPQTIFEPNFGFVDMFLSVPCQTYRDDMVLLVQHRIGFETHSLVVVEPLIWNGEAFEATKSVPCKVGETTELYGASCILDLERDDGLKGSAVILSQDNRVFVLVPRFEAPAGLFEIETELVPKQTEIDDLKAILKAMEAMVADQERSLQILEDVDWIVNTLQTKELTFDGEFSKLLLNGEEWTIKDSEIDLDNLLKDLGETEKQLEAMALDLTVEEAFVKDLYLDNLNGEPYKELVELNHNGTIIFEGDLTVERLFKQPKRQSRDSGDDNQELHLLEIDGNLEFKSINGILWQDFLEQVVFKNTSTHLENLKVKRMAIDGDLNVDSLNNLHFPGDFLISSGPRFSKIHGKKTFVNTLNTNAMDCEETFNKRHPGDLISLQYDQRIPGTISFKQLEVTDSFEVAGTISGKNLDQFVENPTLLDTHRVIPECQFTNLKVDGPVIVKGRFNRWKFDDILDNVIYKSEENVMIRSKKKFQDVQFDEPLELKSKHIGGVGLGDFLTKSTDQEVDATEIDGGVFIENLELDGLYNFINVTEMELNSIPLDRDQVVDLDLVFDLGQLFKADTVEILETLNQVPVGDFVNIHEPIHLGNVSFDQINVEELSTECNIEGKGLVNGVDLVRFNKQRLSITEDQTVDFDVTADTVEVETDLDIKLLNGYPIEDLLKFLKKSVNTTELLRSARKLKITGDVNIHTLNGVDTDQLWSQVIWLDRKNTITEPLHFLDTIYLQDDLRLESNQINGRDFEAFVNDLVLKNDEANPIIISGTKRFMVPINVTSDSTIRFFNDIPSNLVATKVRPLRIQGDLHIEGDLKIHSLNMEGEKFGYFHIQDILEAYQYDSESDMHFIKGEVEFKGQTTVDRLTIDGKINGFEGPNTLFKEIVFKNMSTTITGRKVFKNILKFDQGVTVGTLNGLDVARILDNVVYVNSKTPVEIWNPIVFKSPITAEGVQVEGNVFTSNVMGCQLSEWLNNSLRIDQSISIQGPVLFQPGVLDGGDILTVYLNDHFMPDVITLHTPQNFTGNITLPSMHLDGSMVAGKVNDLDLVKERQNTLMLFGDQHITAPVITQSIQVLRNLETLEPINGRNLREVATLYDDLHFQSSFTFKHIQVQNVDTNYSISGLNFTDWYEHSLKTGRPEPQTITGLWSIDELNIHSQSVVMKPPLLIQNNTDLYPSVKTLQESYLTVCKKVMKLKEQAQDRVSFLKYLKKDFEIVSEEGMNSVYPLILPESTLLLLNGDCTSKVYAWNTGHENLNYVGQIQSGRMDRVEALSDTAFVTHADSKSHFCNIYGSNVWNFDGHKVTSSGSSNKPGYYSYRSAELIDQNEAFIADFKPAIEGILEGLADELHSLENYAEISSSYPPIVGAPPTGLRHAVKHIAKKLWDRFKELDDVKTVVHHARKLYHRLADDESDHHHLHHGHEEHDSYHENKDPNEDHQLFENSDPHHADEGSNQNHAHHAFENDHSNPDHHGPHKHKFDESHHQVIHGDHEQDEFIGGDEVFDRGHEEQERLHHGHIHHRHHHSHHRFHSHHHPHDPEQLDQDSMVGASWPSIPLMPPIFPLQPQIPHPSVAPGLQTVMNALPLGFRNLVDSTARSANGGYNTSGINTGVRELIGTITEALNSTRYGSPQPSARHKRSCITFKRSLMDSMVMLQKYAGEPSEPSLYPFPGGIQEGLIDSNTVTYERREAVAFAVGSTENRFDMFGVISPSDLSSIRLYFQDMRRQFQKIETTNPHSLTTLEIKHETILAFIDGLSLVRVMKYKGVEGTFEFAEELLKINKDDFPE